MIVLGLAAGADDKKDLKKPILELAAALEKNDEKATRKLVDRLKKEDLEDLMSLMKKSATNEAAFDFVKDGIEITTNSLAIKVRNLDANAVTYEKMGHILAAIAEATAEMCPVKTKVGEKDPKNWEFWSRDFKAGAKAPAEGAKKKDPEKVHTAAKTIMAACNECHAAFRD